MNTTLRHRGPDDEGYAFSPEAQPIFLGGPNTPSTAYEVEVPYRPTARVEHSLPSPSFVALGHRKLAILDLSPTGHQPMSSPDRHYHISVS